MSLQGRYICLYKASLSTVVTIVSSAEYWVDKEKGGNNYIQGIHIHNTATRLYFVPTVLITETVTTPSTAKQTIDFDWNL
jgi:hypothetical protein